MKKLNQLGDELLKLKMELLNPTYSSIIKKALALQVDAFVQLGAIDSAGHYELTSDEISVVQFEEFLLRQPQMVKTAEEIEADYFTIGEQLVGDNHLQLEIIADIEKERLYIVQSFGFNREDVLRFFDVKEKELDTLMKERGFIAKFTLTRLPKIIDAFRETVTPEFCELIRSKEINMNAKKEGYCMDMLYCYHMESLLTAPNMDAVQAELLSIAEKAKIYYDNKMD